MKRISFLVFLVLGICTVRAQALTEAQVPPAVVSAFQKSFPGIPVKWEKGGSTNYEATFQKETSTQVYVYDQAGVLQVKKQKSTLANMPESVRKSVGVTYPSAPQTDAYKVISRTQEKYFEVHVAQPNGQDRLKYGLDGNLAGKTTLASAPSPASSNIAASTPAPKPAAPAPAPAPKPAVASTPAPQPAVASTPPAPKPAVAATPPAPKPAPVSKPAPSSQPAMAMRGENATTTSKPVLADDDMDIEAEDDADLELLDEKETFEDIDDLLEDHDDDTDLLLEEDDDDWLELDDDDDDDL